MLERAQREFLWQEIRGLYEDTDMTLAEISAWAEEKTGWGPSLSGITNRAARHGWQQRAPRCPIFPVGMLRVHLRDHYANALRAEAKARRGERLSRTEFEKWRQATGIISEGLVLTYTPSAGFFSIPRPGNLPEDEWLTWCEDFADEPQSLPLAREHRVYLRAFGESQARS